MSLESERRAIGTNNEAARRGIGQRMVNDRAAIKAGISAARASTFKADLNTLETSPRKQATLSQRDAKGTRPPTVGTGTYKAPAASDGAGAGIASPLVETESSREYHPAIFRPSTDGAVFFQVRATKKVSMTDANGAAVVMEYQNVTT